MSQLKQDLEAAQAVLEERGWCQKRYQLPKDVLRRAIESCDGGS